MLFTKRRGVKLHVYATRKPVALAMAVLAMVARNTLPFVTGISTLVGARRGPFLQTAFFSESMQPTSNDFSMVLSEASLPIVLVLLAGLLVRTVIGRDMRVSVISNTEVTFADIPDSEPGNIEAKDELGLVVDFLKSPQVFVKLGAKVPKRVLLSGPGDKAQMAKAIAGESGVPFLEIVSSDSPVHAIFAEAQQKAPCVLFIPLDRQHVEQGVEFLAVEDLEKTKESLMSEEHLTEVLQEMASFQNSGIIFVAVSSKQDVAERVSRFFELGVTVGHEPEALVGRRLLKENRLEEAVAAFQLACKGGKWRCGCRFCIAYVASDEAKAELKSAQDLLEKHWQKYHDMRVALPWNGISERSLCVRQSVACDYCSLCGTQGPGGAVSVAGLALATFVAQHDPPGHSSKGDGKMAPWSGVKVLELGSGTGIAGLAAASAGADVLLTDRSYLVPLLARNIRLNQDQIYAGSADCAAFEWAEAEKPSEEVRKQNWDIVLGADLVHTSDDVPLFADTLAFLIGPLGAAAGASAVYVHCPQSEMLDIKLQCALKEHGLSWKELPAPSAPGAGDEVVFWELRSSSEGATAASASRVLLGQRYDIFRDVLKNEELNKSKA